MRIAKRLFRFVTDPRYRLLYGGPWMSTERLCYQLQVRLLTADLCTAPDVPRRVLYSEVAASFWEEISPRWEWPEYLGNSVFVIGCWYVVLWTGSKLEILASLPLLLLYFTLRSLFWWVRHSEEKERLYWRLQCEAII
jgi:hypothetical protein